MSFPPRASYVYVRLSENATNGLQPRPSGTTVNSFVQMSTVPGDEPKPPTQPSFYGSQMWYQNYPPVCVAKVHMPYYGNNWPDAYSIPATTYGTGNRIYLAPFTDNVLRDSTFPDNIVYNYNPATPSPADPVPDPNGTVGTNTTSKSSFGSVGGYPRWQATDTAYDRGNAQVGNVPVFDTEYFINELGFYPIFSPYYQITGPWSVDVTVENFQSEVYNQDTMANEYYDFAQTTFDYKQTAKVKLYLDAFLCCWDIGTVITGNVTFQSISVETTALGRTQSVSPDPSYSYGFAGLIAKTGSSAVAAGTQSFTVTVDSGYVPVEIEIPTVAGAISFVNDFSVDSVTPPA